MVFLRNYTAARKQHRNAVQMPYTYYFYIQVHDEQIQTTTAWQSFLHGHRVVMAVGPTVLGGHLLSPHTRIMFLTSSLRLLSLPLHRRRRTRFRALVINTRARDRIITIHVRLRTRYNIILCTTVYDILYDDDDELRRYRRVHETRRIAI